jgi:hypothetical protein
MARLLTAQDAPQTVTVRELDLPTLADPDPEVSYTIRLLPERHFQSLRKAHTTRRPKGGQMVEDVDDRGLSAAIIDWVIQDWTGIVARDEDGGLVPVPCTPDAKLGLDPYVRGALVDLATKNQRVEASAASFRAAP